MLRMYSLMLALALGLSGCASWFEDDSPPPHVSLVKVEVVRAKLLEQKFKLYFRVDNRDDADLTVRGLIYKVTLGDFVLTEGESNEWLTVPPRSHKFFRVSVRTNLWPQIRDVVQMLKNPEPACAVSLGWRAETGLFIG